MFNTVYQLSFRKCQFATHYVQKKSRLPIHVHTIVSLQLSSCNVISQVSMCRRDHGRRTSPDSGRMPDNLCRLPTGNACHHKMIGKF